VADWQVIQGDCIDVMRGIPEHKVDLIVTDPPYAKEYEHYYGEMAYEAKRLLRVGGSLVTLCGHHQLHRILPDMAKHLKYRWIIKFDQPGSYAHLSMGILVSWKPMVWFVNEKLSPRRCITDSVISKKKEKSSGHPWQQSIIYASWAIERLTDEGQVVLDPFCGSGTGGVACVLTNRNFIGIDISEEYCNLSRKRISEATLQKALL
jgi:DNA modification methylase